MEVIKKSSAIVQEQKTIINSSREKVWQTITDIDNWDKWGGAVNSKLHGPLLPGTKFDWELSLKLHATIQDINPNHNFSWNATIWGVTVFYTCTLNEVNHVTTVYVREQMEGIFAPVLKKSFLMMNEQDMYTWLELLKIASEKE